MNITPVTTFPSHLLNHQKVKGTVSFSWSAFHPSLVALGFLVLNRFFSDVFLPTSVSFLVAGFIFPGMTHGSLDYYLVLNGSTDRSAKLNVLALYVGSVVLGFFMWMVSPLIILTLFLLHSAFHFGETDLQLPLRFRKALQCLYGSLLILFFFFSHADETAEYLLPFDVRFPGANTITSVLIPSILFVALTLMTRKFATAANATNILIVLAVGTQLPLLLSFGIYYILIHSLTAWRHLQEGLAMNSASMIKKAAPFTLGGLLFMAVAYLFFQQSEVLQHHPVPLVIIGLSAITLPHTLSMSLFYRRLQTPGKAVIKR